MKRLWLKIILKSVLCGIVITILLVCISLLIENKIISRILLSPIAILQYLAGEPPILGYDNQGNPFYEGTPLDFFIAIFGIILCIPLYSAISFLALVVINHKKKTAPK
jgi:hypothetical protein